MKQLTIYFIAIMLFMHCTEADRANPFDPQSPNTRLGGITGNVLPTSSAATVHLISVEDDTVSDIIDADGVFEFEHQLEGIYTISISAEDYRTLELDRIKITASQEMDLGTLVLSSTSATGDTTLPSSIFGVVIDSKSQEPIESVAMTGSGPTSIETLTNESGRYSFVDIEPGSYELGAVKQGYLSGSTSREVAAHTSYEVNFSLTPVGILSGTVTDSQSSASLDSVLIEVGGYATYTNSQGSYYLNGIIGGSYVASYSRNGYLSGLAPIEIKEGEITEKDISLIKYGTVVGVISSSLTGDPIEGAIIASGNSIGFSDANGGYSLNLSPGTHILEVSSTGYVAKTINVTITAGSLTTGNIELASLSDLPTVTISGLVLNAETGERISTNAGELIMYLMDQGFSRFYSSLSPAVSNGIFAFDINLNSLDTALYLTDRFRQGEYGLWLLGTYLSDYNFLIYREIHTITEANSNNLRIELKPGAIVGGNISDEDHEPIEGVSVSIGAVTSSTNSDGFYLMKAVDPDRGQISLSAQGYHALESAIVLLPGETHVFNANLVSMANLTGTVIDSTNRSGLEGAMITVSNRTTTSDSQGKFTFLSLDESDIILSVAKIGYNSTSLIVSIPYTGEVSITVEMSRQ